MFKDQYSYIEIDFDFKALVENDNQWVNIYNKVNEGLQNTLYFVFPILDEKFLWLSSKRRQMHKDLDHFIEMIEHVIQARRNEINLGDWHNKNLEENEKDILSLMIESENRGEGILSNEELKVVNVYMSCLFVCILIVVILCRAISFYSFLQAMRYTMISFLYTFNND